MNEPLDIKGIENVRWLAMQLLNSGEGIDYAKASKMVCENIPRYEATVTTLIGALDNLLRGLDGHPDDISLLKNVAEEVLNEIAGAACVGCYIRAPHLCKLGCTVQTYKK